MSSNNRRWSEARVHRSTRKMAARLLPVSVMLGMAATICVPLQAAEPQTVTLKGDAGGPRFDGIGVVNGGGATSVLLKDYPEPQRSQILDLVYKPKFGASVSALLVEIPGDGNSTQGSMPSHMRTRNDLNYSRGYTWWILSEAKQRNPQLSLDGTAWSVPGWIGDNGQLFDLVGTYGDKSFFAEDTVDYYIKWLEGLRKVYGLEFDAIGVRNEKGVSYGFAKALKQGLLTRGFENVKLHAYDNWPAWKLDFVSDMAKDKELRDAIDIFSAHTFITVPATPEVQALAKQWNKPIWNTEDHVYKKGFDCAISIVETFNQNYIGSGVTKIVNWYDIAGIYAMEPYSEDPAALLARSPWSGHYEVREALWGYAHYGQFSEIGWQYLAGGSGKLSDGGSYVTLKAPASGDYSVIIETKLAKTPQTLRLNVSNGLSAKALSVWRSNEKEQFIRQPDLQAVNGSFNITLEPGSIYSLTTTSGQQKGSFDNIPQDQRFPFPYLETFERYSKPEQYGYLPRYLADIEEVFELTPRPDQKGMAIRQAVPVWPIYWAPSWKPYTIIGDETWGDYEVSADIYLNPGDTAGVMGRVNNVGTGYGTIPKGYFLQLSDTGELQLVIVRGKKPKITGDAEQQAMLKKLADAGDFGEKVLATQHVSGIKTKTWHQLKLRFAGSTITGIVDGKQVISVKDSLYAQGMAGLMAAPIDKNKLSTPYYDNLLINAVGCTTPKAAASIRTQLPIYPKAADAKR